MSQYTLLDNVIDQLIKQNQEKRHPSEPPYGIWYDDSAHYIEVDLPGVLKSDTTITLQNNTLKVKWSRRLSFTGEEVQSAIQSLKDDGGQSIKLPTLSRTSQVRDGSIEFHVPNGTLENSTASLINGVLSLVIPKVQPGKIVIS